uniref:B30.2/SPRY domain-containing protein n=1 Tax=Seriola lalandi dorsalis TaxID=1841481 RepID=A0A3B4X105_SERLL
MHEYLYFVFSFKARQDRMRAELQQKIKIRKQQVAEVRLSVKGCKVRFSKFSLFIFCYSFSFSYSFYFFSISTVHYSFQVSLDAEWLKINSVFSEVKDLDPTTAHQFLFLSDDGKKVRDGGKTRKVPDTPRRFDMYGSVLGINSLTSGKSYWEVEVGNKTGWDLGVARGDANRKGELSLNPDNGYWVTVHYEGKRYAALSAPPVCLPLKEKPQKVGVFVDYEEGLVSFYDVTAQSHIFSFTECSFSGEIFPYFSPHLKQNGKNSDPLIISAVNRQ